MNSSRRAHKEPDYIGSTDDLNRRLTEHVGEGYRSFKTERTGSTRRARSIEKELIKKKQPVRNKIKYAYA